MLEWSAHRLSEFHASVFRMGGNVEAPWRFSMNKVVNCFSSDFALFWTQCHGCINCLFQDSRNIVDVFIQKPEVEYNVLKLFKSNLLFNHCIYFFLWTLEEAGGIPKSKRQTGISIWFTVGLENCLAVIDFVNLELPKTSNRAKRQEEYFFAETVNALINCQYCEWVSLN